MGNLCQFCANWKGERCRMWSAKQFECFWMYSFNLRLSYKYGNSFEHLKAFLCSCNLCSSSSTLSYAKYTVNVMPHSVAKSLRGSLNLLAAPWRKCPAFLLHAIPNSSTRPQGSKKCCRFAFGSGSARRQTCLPFVYNNSNSNRVKRQQQQC